MPKLEVITIKDFPSPGFNLSRSVGRGGNNLFGDVLLIQELFFFIAPSYGFAGLGIGRLREQSIPGVFNQALADVINRYQQVNAHRLLRSDGIIHPASYAGRNIKDPDKPLMTITRLHLDAELAARSFGRGLYTLRIFQKNPLIYALMEMETANK